MASPFLTLLLPGLLGPWRRVDVDALSEGLELPALEALLGRARRVKDCRDRPWPEDMACSCFDIPLSDDEGTPVAPLSWGFDGGQQDGAYILRADPVYLQADMTTLRLLDPAEVTTSRQEADALCAELNVHFGESGPQLEPLHPRRWYLRLDKSPEMKTQPPHQAIGGDLDASLPRGPEGGRWRAWLNEVQMVLYQSPVNEAREACGLPAINGLWLWGGGVRPATVAAPWDRVCSDEDVLPTLAAFGGVPATELSPNAKAWLWMATDHTVGRAVPAGRPAQGSARCLIALDAGYVQVRAGDVEGWRTRLEHLEATWFQPLDQALRTRQLAGLHLLSGWGQRFELGPGRGYGWWRHKRPLQDWLKRVAAT